MTAIERVEKWLRNVPADDIDERTFPVPEFCTGPSDEFTVADLREVVALAKLGQEMKDNGARLRSAARAWKRKPRAKGKR